MEARPRRSPAGRGRPGGRRDPLESRRRDAYSFRAVPSMPQILIVDDDPHVARALVDLLDLHGYTAVRAESGEQALDILSREPADLVLLDVRLPGIDGFETCARIRERHGPSLPVVMLTAFGDPAAVRRGFDAGAEDVLSKPVDTRALILKV